MEKLTFDFRTAWETSGLTFQTLGDAVKWGNMGGFEGSETVELSRAGFSNSTIKGGGSKGWYVLILGRKLANFEVQG